MRECGDQDDSLDNDWLRKGLLTTLFTNEHLVYHLILPENKKKEINTHNL